MTTPFTSWLKPLCNHLLCRGCLGPLDAASEAGLCGACWSGLLPLDANRCPRCALAHPSEDPCPEPVGWTAGDALWDYHGGRPGLGALLVPGIKDGEQGWRRALLHRVRMAPLPAFTGSVDTVTAVPTPGYRRWWRGFDLAEEVARLLSTRLQRPFAATLRRAWRSPQQVGRSESERLRLPRKAISIRPGIEVRKATILLVDDVWTTGTTLLRCAQALEKAGAADIRVLTLFRST